MSEDESIPTRLPVPQTNEVLPTAALAGVIAGAEASAERPRKPAPYRPRGRRLRSGLMLGWCLWLLGSWMVLWWNGGWTVPNVRLMVLAAVVGLMGIWPAVRLSQATQQRTRCVPGASAEERRQPRRPRRIVAAEVPAPDRAVDDVPVRAWARACVGVWVDWLCLMAVFQAVLWPLRLAADWTLAQALWLDAAVAGWSLLTGLLIAWGRGTDRGGWRAVAMAACVGLVVLEPGLWWLGATQGPNPRGQLRGFVQTDADTLSSSASLDAGPTSGGWMRVSPLQTMWVLTTPGKRVLDNGDASVIDAGPSRHPEDSAFGLAQATVVSVSLAALAGWIVMWVLIAGRAMSELGSVAVRGSPGRAEPGDASS